MHNQKPTSKHTLKEIRKLIIFMGLCVRDFESQCFNTAINKITQWVYSILKEYFKYYTSIVTKIIFFRKQ